MTATATAVTVACSMRAMTPFLVGSSTGMMSKMMNYLIGYFSVATSSSMNVVAVRKKELDEGI